MSVPVDLATLRRQVADCGPNAFLVTTAYDGAPHLASVVVTTTDTVITMGAGRTSHANATDRPTVTLLWPTAPQGDYCLIVDALTETIVGETLEVRPVSAILHRLAAADPNAPRCVAVDAETDRSS